MSYSTGLGAYYMIDGMNGFGQSNIERHAQRGQTVYFNDGHRGSPGARSGIAIPKRPGGTVYRGGMRGLGAPPLYTYGSGAGPFMHGYGAVGFGDANSVCADWAAGGAATNPDNAAGMRAATAIQQALNAQGYGPVSATGYFGDDSIAAWNKFAAAKGQTSGWPDCAGITALLGGGGAGSSKASMALGIGLLALLAVGAAALLAKKKHGAKHHGHSGTDKLVIEEHRS